MSSESGSPPTLPLLQEGLKEETAATPPSPSAPPTPSTASSLGRLANKVCRVCNDKALGYNFGVVSCESCKAFFRRNALSSKEFRCPFSENCEVTPLSRRFCQKCRLRKCFEVGMKKEWIMSEDAKQKKAESSKRGTKRAACKEEEVPPKRALDILESVLPPLRRASPPTATTSLLTGLVSDAGGSADSNEDSDSITIPRTLMIKLLTEQNAKNRNQRRSDGRKCECTCNCGYYPTGTALGPPAGRRTDAESQTLDWKPSLSAVAEGTWGGSKTELISMGAPLIPQQPQALTQPNDSGWLPADLASLTPARSLDLDTDDSMYLTMINAAISSEFVDDGSYPQMGQIPPSPMTPGGMSTGSNPAVLSHHEQRKLDELIEANEVMKVVERPSLGEGPPSLSLTQVINMTDIAIRRIIQMSKRIAGFKNLCQEDQIALLKGGCTELMILRGVMTYDPEKDSWHGPQEIKCEVLKGVKGNVYEEHKRYLSSFDPEWRSSEPIMLLLGAITLFTPTRAHVQHKEGIKKLQDTYYALLKRYLETTQGPCEAEGVYEQLFQKIESLHRLNENVSRIFFHVNPKDVEPLLIEIFDLK